MIWFFSLLLCRLGVQVEASPLHEIFDAVVIVENFGFLQALLHVVHLHLFVSLNVPIKLLLLILLYSLVKVRHGDLTVSPTRLPSCFKSRSFSICHMVEVVSLGQCFFYLYSVGRHVFHLIVIIIIIFVSIVSSGIDLVANLSIIYFADCNFGVVSFRTKRFTI